MARHKFIRRNHDKYKRLGGSRKKLVWRRPRGRHGKMREERKGYPSVPKVGRKDGISPTGKLVRNMRDLLEMKKNEVVIIARVGTRKRADMEKKANEIGVKILNKRKIK